MITLLEINKAINNKIEHALADSEFKTVPIIASDLSEPIVRPSLKVFLEDGTTGKFNSCMKILTHFVSFYTKNKTAVVPPKEGSTPTEAPTVNTKKKYYKHIPLCTFFNTVFKKFIIIFLC